MSEPVILFVKPGAIRADDKAALATAGVIVVEVENPQDVKLVRAHAELSGGEMLLAAAKAIEAAGSTGSPKWEFGNAIARAIIEKGKPHE